MTVYYANRNQTANGPGQTVPISSQNGFPNNPTQSWVAFMTGTGTLSASVQIQGSNDSVNWVNSGSPLSASNTAPVTIVTNTTYQFYQAIVSAITGTNAAVTLTMGV